MNYTKGEWKARQTPYGEYEIERNKLPIACAYLTPIEPDCGSVEANARLIASAPDMYEALKHLTEFDEMGGNGEDHYDLIAKAKQALAKAETGS